ncbi:ABC-type transporter, permease component: PepT family [Alloalcanivorax dieselolei B5]|uniref:ABC-type transporter, permease component: PepT family n=1 Tax=Alcanivorax dieselolei (strain DSM 16502 / CGMCC 1.3690 / MCCC 1A00001 / B-5) TaxID=930169 RepID=K0CIL6_ALCDB|nr:ABC transporter permease [Alloalcanivorax dieselolei]AFT71572.1 ABC-type transporter, permease component: PepT family [Alloalcanivorax dieselolei B5]GGJ89855.1 peptide ABC transporter permease [Alloalcanivorax dieselolei]
MSLSIQPPAAAIPATPPRRRPRPKTLRFLRRLCKERPLGALGAMICLVLLLTGLFADVIAPEGFNAINPIERLQAPSATHWLGTDQLGRDVFARIVHGAQLSVIVAFAATTLSIVISALLGILSGYFGGRLDMIIQRLVDGWMCFPDLILLIVAVAVLGPGTWQVILILGLLFGISGSRIIRGAVLSAKQNVYVHAAQSMGASSARILLKHILPNVMAPLIVLYTTRLAAVILAESGLSFLGLGIPPPEPSWGGMLSLDGRSYMFQAPWLAIAPGIALTVAVFGINMFGDALRDLLDPRMRGGGGRYLARVKRTIGS